MNKTIVEFYTKDGKDASGRTFDEIMDFDNTGLEDVHDYIQWIFPTLTPSKCQPETSPVLDEQTIKVLKGNKLFYERYQRALIKILNYWKIPFAKNGTYDLKIKDIPWSTVGEPWTEAYDHNQLRIARVLESTRLLGFKDTSRDLFHALLKFTAKNSDTGLTSKNVAYWYQSASGVNIMGS